MAKTARTSLLTTCLLLASCSTPYSIPKYDSRPPGQTSFDGIAQLLTAQKNAPLDVVMVHGMCTHDADWARDTIRQLSKSLGGPEDIKIQPAAVKGTQIVLFRSDLAVKGGTVRATAMLWSPVTQNLKNQLCYDQTNRSAYCPVINPPTPRYEHDRAELNRDLKDQILNDCLADAMIYQGKSHPEIQRQVQDALMTAAGSSGSPGLLALTDAVKAAAKAPNNLVMITESLGSKVAFDAIRQLREKGELQKQAADRTLERTVQIFMAANQLPILSLADQHLDSAGPPDPLRGLLENRKSLSPLSVVAFTDPNDLLSYALARQPTTLPEKYLVVDVIVSNDSTYFGYVEHPANAHRYYRRNPEVTRRIACGSSGNCP